MRKRLTFECWNCHRNYSLLLELVGKPELVPECPFCGEVGLVNLNPYRQDQVEVFRSDTDEETSVGTRFNFPKVIPTIQPKT